MTPKNILIVAGEPSGDLHASNLVKDLKSLDPDLRFFGLGGNLSRKTGVEVIYDIEKIAVVGLIEVFSNILTIGDVYRKLVAKIDSVRPDLAILVDYPGFNLRLARQLKKRSIPVVYYISPQVWAWGENRINIIKRCVKKIIVFFKFEEGLYKKYGIDAEYVGHPLLDTVRLTRPKEETLKKHSLSAGKTTIALLPGSRTSEIETLLPVMVSAAKIINKRRAGVQFVIAKHPDLPMPLYEDTLEHVKLDVRIREGDTYNILGVSDFAIVASGTATLETAIIGTPLLIVYKTNFLTYLAYNIVSKTRFIGLVNIIAKREVAPELLQFNATGEKIADSALEILLDETRIASIREELKAVRSALGSPGASLRAAKVILPLLE